MHGRATHDFASSSGWEQLVTESIHICGEGGCLVLTDVPEVEGIQTIEPFL